MALVALMWRAGLGQLAVVVVSWSSIAGRYGSTFWPGAAGAGIAEYLVINVLIGGPLENGFC